MNTWEEIESFVVEQVKGGKRVDSETYERIDLAASEKMTSEGVKSLTGKLMDLNILKSNFKVLSNMPNIWKAVYITGMEIAGR